MKINSGRWDHNQDNHVNQRGAVDAPSPFVTDECVGASAQLACVVPPRLVAQRFAADQQDATGANVVAHRASRRQEGPVAGQFPTGSASRLPTRGVCAFFRRSRYGGGSDLVHVDGDLN